MLAQGDGTGQRESWRRFAMGPLAGLARQVEVEIERKFEVRTRFNFDALMAHDIQTRATSFQKLVAGGMDVAKAAAMSGLMGED